MEINFHDFGETPRARNRLVERHKRVVSSNIEHIRGKTVLDLASNNGRWCYAACAAGARKVQGVEGRAEKVDEGLELIARNGFSGSCAIEVADIYDWLFANQRERFDTIFCLGIYYHVLDHNLLLKLMVRLQPECIIIDSGFVRSFDLLVRIQTENPSLHLNALPAYPDQAQEMVGIVSLGMMQQMAWNSGYRVEPVIWDPAEVGDKSSVHDYLKGLRYTLRLRRMQGHADADWKERWRPALKTLNPRFEHLLDEQATVTVEDPRAKSIRDRLDQA